MIRLIVISDSLPTVTRYFDQAIVTIGSIDSPTADLALAEESMENSHIQILLEQQRFYALNLANDPFATINGQPFRKKVLKSNDLIQIGNTVIRFENDPLPSIKPSEQFGEEKFATPSEREPIFSKLVDSKEALPILLEEKFSAFADIPPKTDLLSAWNPTSTNEENASDPQNDDIFYEDYFENQTELSFEDPVGENSNELDEFDVDALVRQVEELDDKDENFPLIPREVFDEDEKETINKAEISFSNLATQLPYEQLPPEIKPIESTPKEPHSVIESLNTTPGSPQKEPPLAQSRQSQTNTNASKLSLKDYYLSEYDDVGEAPSTSAENQGPSFIRVLLSSRNWKIYLKFIFAFAVVAFITLGLTFLWMTDQSDKEEITASKGVADVAMALTYAQIKNIHPQNQNWSDPEFIKNNLTAVLPSKFGSCADFDGHGQFTNCPYFIRIYTSGDLSQFLVIAQPAPSLLQWLIPKSTIIIDSQAMEMRKTKDLKSLNRLLVSANTLDGTSALEVSNLVRQGQLIPLASLVNKSENIGFSPPKALALIRPGAENLVYNAPRYFPLGEELMKKSLDFIEKPASSHEVTRLQQELMALSKFPNAVLYASGGIQNALHAQKALATLSPKEKFLIAYLQINTKGQIANSHLLMDDTLQEMAMSENFKPASSHSAGLRLSGENSKEATTPSEISSAESSENIIPLPQSGDIDEDNPLFLQLSALNVYRQQVLRPICDEIVSLLNKETQSSQKNFEMKAKQLLTKYIDVNNEQQIKIQRKLDGIYRENTFIPAAQFFHLAKITGLKEPLKDYLNHLKHLQNAPEFTQEKLDKRLQKIEKAQNWQDLEQEIAELVEILNLERIPHEDTIVAYQNATRSRVIQKLNQFILSPEHPLTPQAFDAEYRYTLIHILQMSWITDSDTYDFYLSEFDLRALPRGAVPEDEEEEEEE